MYHGPVLCWNDAVNVADVLIDLYGRLPPLCHEAVEGLTPEQLVQPPAPGANTIGWLVWHLALHPRCPDRRADRRRSALGER